MGLENLLVAKRKCDRCGFRYLLEELVEDPSTPGIFVCKAHCVDDLSFQDLKRDNPKEGVPNYFGVNSRPNT